MKIAFVTEEEVRISNHFGPSPTTSCLARHLEKQPA